MKSIRFTLMISLLIFSFLSCETETKEDLEPEENGEIEIVNFLGATYSCGDISVNVLENNEDAQRALIIFGGTKDDLSLTEEPQTFDLPIENLNLSIRDYDLPLNSSFFCNDIIFDPWPQITEEWNAISGGITMSVSNIESNSDEGLFDIYNLSILLENVVFENEDGEQLMVEDLELEDLYMGWLPG